MMENRILIVVGTRPEAIKLAPVIKRCQESQHIDPIVCLTGQHREMLRQVTDYFQIHPEHDLEVMKSNQSLSGLTANCIEGIDKLITRFDPACILAQGDTTTVMTSSMAAFFRRLPFIHVEAGLRTGDLYSPWPEEFNRRVVGLSASVHCAPTEKAAQNLLDEGVRAEQVHVTGNTVVDALLWTVNREKQNDQRWIDKYRELGQRRMVLITGHRRENMGKGFESICEAILSLADRFRDVLFVYPVHLNPNVREPVHRILGNQSNIRLIAPVPYPEFVWLMYRSYVILTDSGGVQEEAPSLRKPVIVMRDTTERGEAEESGAVRLVGTNASAIESAVTKLLSDEAFYASCQIDQNPFGDGRASERIVELIEKRAWERPQRFAAA